MEEVNYDQHFGLRKLDSDLLKSFNSTLKELRGLVISNIEFFQRGRSALHARFYASSCILLERTQILEPIVLEIVPYLYKFDFSEEVPGNGYRSFISLLYRCCLYLLQLCRHIHGSRSSLFFQSSRYCKDLECYVETLGQLLACLTYLKQLMAYCSDGELFLKDDNVVGDNLLLQLEMINVDCFYGRCVGFQFCETMQKALQAVLVVMATFSECYDEPSQVMQLASSLLNSGKYVLDQELRARQVVNITRTGDIKFCKQFWSIPESPILSHLRSFTFPRVEVSDIISLEPVNFELPSTCSEETVTITPPCAHTGPTPVQVRLISHAIREGQDTTRRRLRPKTGSAKPVILPKSPNLLFHVHGGGFVAQSSQSHENYLRAWARELEVPILSVDYSLAPEHPFPRALEECFYAYAWALKNPDKLGWTGERVCFAGDSAGANLVVSTALRAVSFEIRIPDGVVSMYAPFLIQYSPSPARFMSMIDPLLPVGILMRCLAAYAGIADEFSSALAKPIFCNPGSVEAWEMVDSSEIQHIKNYIGEIKPHSDNDTQAQSNADDVALPNDEVKPLSNIKHSVVADSVNSKEVMGDDNVTSKFMSADNVNSDIQNQMSKPDGASQINYISNDQNRNEALGDISNRCSVNTGCEINSDAQNAQIPHEFGAASNLSNQLSVNTDAIETQPDKEMSSNIKESMFKDCKNEEIGEDNNTGYYLGDIVFVDKDMIPEEIDTVENHPAGLTSSKLFGVSKIDNQVKSLVSSVENPVKSLVSGVKSFMSRHKKAKLSAPEMDPNPKTSIDEDTSVKSLGKEQIESAVDVSMDTVKVESHELLRETDVKNTEEELNPDCGIDSVLGTEMIQKKNDTDSCKDCHAITEEVINQNVGFDDDDINHQIDSVVKENSEKCIEEENNIHHTGERAGSSENKQHIHQKIPTEGTVNNGNADKEKIDIAITDVQPVCTGKMEVNDENSSVVNDNTFSEQIVKINEESSHLEVMKETASQQTDMFDNVEPIKTSETEAKMLCEHTLDDDIQNDNDDNDEDDAEDMEIYFESIVQHSGEEAKTDIISSCMLTEKQNVESRKENKKSLNDKSLHVDSKGYENVQKPEICDTREIIADSSAANCANNHLSESKVCRSENVQHAESCDKTNLNVQENQNDAALTNEPDPNELYAVCQELLDEAGSSGQEYGACGYSESLTGSSSCHTLEDRSSYYYGYDRRLSIHSEGSCDSIEDSHAWITGQDIDITEVDSNDIVTVINDCDQTDLQEKLETNSEKMNEPKFYIETQDPGYVESFLSGNKLSSKDFSASVSNVLETINSGIKNLEKSFLSKADEASELKDLGKLNMEQEHVMNCQDESVSKLNETEFKDDRNQCSKTVGNETEDKPRAESDPSGHTAGAENHSETETTRAGSRKECRRTMSLDLTNDFNACSDNKDFLSQPKSMTLPRSSTVPELLSGSVTPKYFSVQRNIAQSPIQLFRKLPIVKNPYMSPILAPDDMIQGLPVVYLVACHFDPLLDDSVMFARKLRNLGKNVHLHIVDNLPHGFLNFSDASLEAKQASKYCLNRIKEVLKIEEESSGSNVLSQ